MEIISELFSSKKKANSFFQYLFLFLGLIVKYEFQEFRGKLWFRYVWMFLKLFPWLCRSFDILHHYSLYIPITNYFRCLCGFVQKRKKHCIFHELLISRFLRFYKQLGVDWKSLTIPACLPITTDYFPDKRSLQNDYLVSDYNLLPDDVNADFAQQRAIYKKPLTTAEVFKELVSQRLAQVKMHRWLWFSIEISWIVSSL